MSVFVRTPCDADQIRAIAAPKPCARRHERWVLAATVLGSSMAFIDGTVVNVMLPVLQTAFGADVAQIQWVVEAYALFLSALLLLGGALGDRFGRRRVLSVGISVFTLASLACAVAPTIEVLILTRALQGMGAALLVPGSLAVISVSFSSERRGRAIGIWSGFSAIASGLGVVLGGFLLDTLSWRAIFFLNLPIAVVTLVLLYRYVPESSNPESRYPLDWFGSLLSVAALGGLSFGLIEVAGRGLSDAAVIAAFATGLVAVFAFVFYERRTVAPMVPPSLFRSRVFCGVNILTFFVYSTLGILFFFLPLDLIQIQGLSTTAAGAATLPIIALMFVLSGRAGRIVDRYGARIPLTAGPLVMAIGFGVLLSAGPQASYWRVFFPALTILGLGLVGTVAPLTTTVMASIPDRYAGLASGINNAISRAAGLIAIALFGPVFYTVFAHRVRNGLGPLQLAGGAQSELVGRLDQLAAVRFPDGLSAAQSAQLQRLVETGFTAAFDTVIVSCMALAVAASLTALATVGASRMGKVAN